MKEALENLVESMAKLIDKTIQKAADEPNTSDIEAITRLSAAICRMIEVTLFFR